MSKFKALIVGAGKIGAFFDEPSSPNVLTHAHAYQKHPSMELIGFVDANINQARRAAKIWGGQSYSSLDKAFKETQKIDVVSVCVPDDAHYSLLQNLAERTVKLVFAEKPLTSTINEAQEIIRLYKKNHIPLLVNYSRRFVPEILRLKQKITRGDYGQFITGVGYYGKGLVHNGSHMVDLIRLLVGDIVTAQLITRESDFFPDDPSVSALLNFKNGRHLALLHLNCQNYTLFELDLVFSQGRIRLRNSGNTIEEFLATDSPIVKGYKFLDNGHAHQTKLNQALLLAIDNIYHHLTQQRALLCPAEEGLHNLAGCLKIKEAF